MKKITLFAFVFLIIPTIHKLCAQNPEIDSLENLLKKHQRQDTVKVDLMNETAYKLWAVDIDKTLKYAKEAGKLAVDLKYPKGTAESIRLIGIYYLIKGNYTKATTYFKRSLELNEDINEKTGVSNCLNGLGIICYYQGNYPQAVEYYRKALLIFEETGEKSGITNCLLNIGLIYRIQQNYPEALEYYKKALKIDEELGNKKGISNCLNNIGVVYDFQNNYPYALEYFQKALKIKEEIGERTGISACLINIGAILRYQGNYSSALEYYKKALKIREELGDKRGISENLLSIGTVYLNTKDYGKALEYTQRSFKIAEEIEHLELKKDLYKQFSDIYAGIRNFEKAYEHYILFKELNDSLFNEENIKQITGLEYQYKYEKERQAYELEQQKKDAVASEVIKRQKIVSISFIIGFFLMALLVLIVFRNVLQKRKANHILLMQKKEIENKNEELNQQNDEIQLLNENLTSTNKQLNAHRLKLEKMLKQLKETQSQLVQSEKMASIGVLTSGIAHEINNPLNFIQGGKFVLEKYIKDNLESHLPELLPYFNFIDEGINRASLIVDSLNRFSRISESASELCDIHSIIDNCTVMLKNETKDKIEIIKEYSPNALRVKGNEGRLHQVILNILTNAVQAIQEKGVIKISTCIKKENIFIKIYDTGQGISEENLKRITDPFFTTKEPGTGTGLGLSIAYSIINEHKGSIEFESEVGKGTAVIVSLPVSR